MCGICGVVSLNDARPDEKTLAQMVETLGHRGPDDSGYTVSGPCGLGNTRLAVIDLSEAGHQPMHVRLPGRYGPHEAWIAYNGEVYGFKAVRAVLEARGHMFTSDTDTETLLRAYLAYGSPAFIHAFRGMFALAIWDKTHRRLTLFRDRLGQKPLYYTVSDGWLVFGSEIKALLAHPAVQVRLNEPLIPHYLAYGYPPAPQTLFEGILSLPPGHTLTIDLDDPAPAPRIEPYWEPPFPTSGPELRSEDEVAEELQFRLRQVVGMRMIADVPLGAFLSGGLDSAAVVALMAYQSSQPVKTFAIGFENEPSFDETGYARQVAELFETEHHEFILKPDVVNLVEELVWHHDQPFGDSSAIPTYLVSQQARAFVTVALTGDGGDELFAGYERIHAARLAATYARLPSVTRRAIGGMLGRIPESTGYRGLVRRANRFVQGASLPLSERYLSWVRYVPAAWVETLVGAEQEQHVLAHYQEYFQDDIQQAVPLAHLLDVNLRTYLLDDLLVKVDRCSMAVSLEARSPFLDHHLLEFANGVSCQLKLHQGKTKYILKQAMRGLLPDSIIDRQKHGFGVPVGAWFRGELAGYVRAVLLGESALGRGIFDRSGLEAMLETHLSGEADLGHALWTLLTFELWMQRYFD
ncbi:MAG: asparagine synthase (glutamine-hydrolyzing) [Chloroflexota bacterium]